MRAKRWTWRHGVGRSLVIPANLYDEKSKGEILGNTFLTFDGAVVCLSICNPVLLHRLRYTLILLTIGNCFSEPCKLFVIRNISFSH